MLINATNALINSAQKDKGWVREEFTENLTFISFQDIFFESKMEIWERTLIIQVIIYITKNIKKKNRYRILKITIIIYIENVTFQWSNAIQGII